MKPKFLHTGLAMMLAVSGVFAQSGETPVVLGGNLEGTASWSYSNLFADLMKQGRDFGLPTTPWTGKPKLDGQGWPAEDFGIVLADWAGANSHGGIYKISFRCGTVPTITLPASPGKIQNVRRDAATGLVTAELDFPSDGAQLMMGFIGTKGGVRDLRVLRPGCTPGELFTKPFLDHCRRFAAFRFMDSATTNGSPVRHWTDRTLPSSPSYAAGRQVPWEVCIALCNRLKRDAWVNIPHQADDDYIQHFARLLRSTLDPSLHVYVEYSNEVWNWGFAQATWNKNQAAADVAAGDLDLNYDKVNDKNVWTARRIGKRIKTISDIFRKVYGDAGWAKTVRPVLATQIEWPAYWLVDALTFLNDRFGPPNRYLYACAGAPYFNLGDADKRTDLTKDDVLKALRESVDDFGRDLNVDTCATLSRYYNLKFVGYEGGPDTFGPNNIAAKKAAALDPRMQAICVDYLNAWYSYGFGLLNWFVIGATNYDTQFGTWGLTNDMANQAAPKIKAVDQVLAERVVPLSKGIPVPGSVDPRQFAMRDAHWQTSGDLVLSPTDWRGPFRDYLLRVRTGGPHSVLISLGPDKNDARMEILVNNSKQGSVAIPHTPADFVIVSTAVSLPTGMNVLRLKIASGKRVSVLRITVR